MIAESFRLFIVAMMRKPISMCPSHCFKHVAIKRGNAFYPPFSSMIFPARNLHKNIGFSS
jgi:hypothetical protein